MNPPGFHKRSGALWIDDLPVTQLVERYGTPLYLYAGSVWRSRIQDFQNALVGHPHQLYYAIKANSHLHILQTAYRAGLGFDIVSGGELARLHAVGAATAPVVFSGVGKTPAEIQAAWDLPQVVVHMESVSEWEMIHALCAAHGRRLRIGLRLNPDVSAATHPYIATGARTHKFGIPWEAVPELATAIARSSWVEFGGISCHIGSQITDISAFQQAARAMLAMADTLKTQWGLTSHYLDLGGGLGIPYAPEQPAPAIDTYIRALTAVIPPDLPLWLEPGRALIGPAGMLITRVIHTKTTGTLHFAIVDAGMTELMRPALYQAYHPIDVITPPDPNTPARRWEIAGPVCETGDILGHGRLLPIAPQALLGIAHTGAYGTSMASHYNSRPRAPEVWVEGDHSLLIRPRQSYADLWQSEYCQQEPPFP